MLARLAAAAAVLAAGALADCPNGCSLHGTCGANDECVCDAGRYGADCSQRVCPVAKAWADIPLGDLNHDGQRKASTYVTLTSGNSGVSNGAAYELFPVDATQGGWAAKSEEGHFYMECSGVGSCDTATGQCTCPPGYTGAACQRAKCPNDCSGHGRCRSLSDIAAGALTRRAVGSQSGNLLLEGVTLPFSYALWDGDMHQACVCDGGFTGADCSQRTCPMGNDPLTPDTPRYCGGERCTPEVQEFVLSSADSTTYRFAFTDLNNVTTVALATVNILANAPGYVPDPATQLPAASTNAGIIMDALRNAPGSPLGQVEVMATATAAVPAEVGRTFRITYVGLPGNQYDMDITAVAGPGRVEVAPFERARGNMEATPCSSRGNCDATTGQCKCFPGYSGAACEHQNALAGAKPTSAPSK